MNDHATPASDAPAVSAAATVEGLLAELKRPAVHGAVDITKVLRSAQVKANLPLWRGDPRLYRAFVRRLIKSDHPMRAVDLADEGLEAHAGDPELRYLRTLALRRGGNVSKNTEQEIEKMLEEPGLDRSLRVEALSLLGALYKVRFERARGRAGKATLAAKSAGWYRQAYEASTSNAWYPAINAATLSLLGGDPDGARRMAARVIELAGGEADGDYWRSATLGEAHLILGQQGPALEWYARAVQGASGALGDLASMKCNLLLLSRRLAVDEAVSSLFNLGSVVAFVGHMIDHPLRRSRRKLPPRFPPDPELERRVAEAIDREIIQLDARVGYCSVACGSDILFAEKMLERGADVHIVLPFALEDFYFTSVDFGYEGRRPWRDRAQAVLERAKETHYATSENFLGDDTLLEWVNVFAQGLAVSHARRLSADSHALAVVDPASRTFTGGTKYFLEQWAAAGRPARIIDLAELRQGLDPAPDPLSSLPAPPAPETVDARGRSRRTIKAMLFADVKNFSKLDDRRSAAFLVPFLNAVANILKEFSPAFCNTWGDGLFLVFNTIREAADFAHRLLELMQKHKWVGFAPDAKPAVRVGLHGGPVFSALDRIIKRDNFFGSHVNRAARIEPVTMIGCAYASEQFAAALALDPELPYECQFVGVETLPKDGGEIPLYRLEKR